MNAKHYIHFVFSLLLFYSFSTTASERVPFRLAGNLLLIKATINGQTGDFIFDTGAPELIVNQAHFAGVRVPWAQVSVVDFHGQASEAGYFPIHDFAIGGLEIKQQYALSIDLKAVEQVKNISLLGIIGYSVLKDLEIVFDFDYQELILTPIKNKRTPTMSDAQQSLAVFDLHLSGHIPFLVTQVGKKKFRMGIDSGAEVNILHQRANKKAKVDLNGARSIRVKSISRKQQTAKSGVLTNMSIDGYATGPLEMTVLNILPLNESLTIDLDGLLGIPFLKKGKMAINYKRRKLYAWPLEGSMVNQDLPDEGTEVSLEW